MSTSWLTVCGTTVAAPIIAAGVASESAVGAGSAIVPAVVMTSGAMVWPTLIDVSLMVAAAVIGVPSTVADIAAETVAAGILIPKGGEIAIGVAVLLAVATEVATVAVVWMAAAVMPADTLGDGICVAVVMTAGAGLLTMMAVTAAVETTLTDVIGLAAGLASRRTVGATRVVGGLERVAAAIVDPTAGLSAGMVAVALTRPLMAMVVSRRT